MGEKIMSKKTGSFFKKVCFSLVTIAFLVGFAEAGLRLTGFHDYPELVMSVTGDDGKQVCRINEAVGERYLRQNLGGQSVQMPRIFSDTLECDKPAHEFRVFVLGESSVQGYPYPYNIAFPAQLEIMLNDQFPKTGFHVINCGVTALNSFAILDFAEELLEYEPDLFVIYTGHNEFYGAFGAGSAVTSLFQNRRLTRGLMTLQSTAVYRVFQRIVLGISDRFSPEDPPVGLIEIMAKNKSIPVDSGVFQTTMDHFRGNLEEICNRASRRKVPVLVCSLVSNIEGLSPMGSEENDSAEFRQLRTTALSELSGNDIETAARTAEQIKSRFPGNAWGYFVAGKAANMHRAGSGCSDLATARDLDGLRFRAPGHLNRIGAETAKKFGNMVHFAAMEPVFDANSESGCPGYNLFVDHVHPTAYGHYLIARTIANRLVETRLIPDSDDRSVQWPDWNGCRQIAGYTDVEELITQMQILSLYRTYPLQTLQEAPDRIREADRRIREIYGSLPGVMQATYERWVGEGGRFDLHFEAGKTYLQNGDCVAAANEFALALKAHPGNTAIIEFLGKAESCV